MYASIILICCMRNCCEPNFNERNKQRRKKTKRVRKRSSFLFNMSTSICIEIDASEIFSWNKILEPVIIIGLANVISPFGAVIPHIGVLYQLIAMAFPHFQLVRWLHSLSITSNADLFFTLCACCCCFFYAFASHM